MAKCRLGNKKLARIAAILGPRYSVSMAFTRGGREHFLAECFVIDQQEEPSHKKMFVNYKTGEVETWKPGPLQAWIT